jgi:hypothetical protein
VQVVILDFQSLFQIREGRPELFCSSENACEIIVCNCPVLVAFFGKSFSFSEEFKGNIEVLYNFW